MDFLENLGSKIRKTSVDASLKIKKMQNINALKNQAAKVERNLDDLYAQLGRQYYEVFFHKEPPEFTPLFSAIYDHHAQLEGIRREIAAINDEQTCVNCGLTFSRYIPTCPNCGAMAPDYRPQPEPGAGIAQGMQPEQRQSFGPAQNTVKQEQQQSFGPVQELPRPEQAAPVPQREEETGYQPEPEAEAWHEPEAKVEPEPIPDTEPEPIPEPIAEPIREQEKSSPEPQRPAGLFCPNCGKPISLTAVFCTQCGFKLPEDLMAMQRENEPAQVFIPEPEPEPENDGNDEVTPAFLWWNPDWETSTEEDEEDADPEGEAEPDEEDFDSDEYPEEDEFEPDEEEEPEDDGFEPDEEDEPEEDEAEEEPEPEPEPDYFDEDWFRNLSAKKTTERDAEWENAELVECPHCGTLLMPGASFCTHCGNKVD